MTLFRATFTSSLTFLRVAARMRTEALTVSLPPLLVGTEGLLPHYSASPRNEVTIVQPVLIKQVGNNILTLVSFLPQCLLTGMNVSHVKFWISPLPMTSLLMRDYHDLGHDVLS